MEISHDKQLMCKILWERLGIGTAITFDLPACSSPVRYTCCKIDTIVCCRITAATFGLVFNPHPLQDSHNSMLKKNNNHLLARISTQNHYSSTSNLWSSWVTYELHEESYGGADKKSFPWKNDMMMLLDWKIPSPVPLYWRKYWFWWYSAEWHWDLNKVYAWILEKS
jgi:hypothetical protein